MWRFLFYLSYWLKYFVNSAIVSWALPERMSRHVWMCSCPLAAECQVVDVQKKTKCESWKLLGAIKQKGKKFLSQYCLQSSVWPQQLIEQFFYFEASLVFLQCVVVIADISASLEFFSRFVVTFEWTNTQLEATGRVIYQGSAKMSAASTSPWMQHRPAFNPLLSLT